jgi:membrane protein DedA with SNARE-associated domain
MDVVAVVGLAALILVKEAGVPLPVPGDLLIIGAGASLAGDLPSAGAVLAVILVAGFVGASVQFLLFGTALRRPLLAALERLGIGAARLDRLSDRFRAYGIGAVALTRMTPGVRIAVVPAAALAAIPFSVFLPGVVAGNGVFVTAHFGAGFLLGSAAEDLVRKISDPRALGAIVLVVLAVGGLLVLRMRAAAANRADTYECWADCSCPACVAIVAVGVDGEPTIG